MAKVTLDLAKFDGMATEASERGVQSALLQGEALLKADILSRPGTGRQYGKHRASSPGEPPAPDTGRLRAATAADTQLRRDGDDVVGRIVVNTEYAAAMELGTEKIAPRPYLGRLKQDRAQHLQSAFLAGAKGEA